MNAITEPRHFELPTLADRAMLVRLSRSVYQPYAFDQATTVKVEIDSGVRKAGRFNKRLFLDCYQLKDTLSAFNDVYQYHMRNTVPWLDDGVRMLPSNGYFDYTQGMSTLMETARAKAQALAVVWPQLVHDDITRLGAMANAADYPTNIADRFSLALKFLPVPSTADFRVQISDEDKASLESAIAEAEAGVSKYLLAELLEPIKRATEKLAVPIGADGSIFRDTLLSNITEVAQRAKRLNLTQDPAISSLVDEINGAIGGYVNAPDMLREDITARNTAQTKLADIMSKMGAFMGAAQ